uniref:integrase core domain-containing protein n=1 Tax=Acidithiobacillus caldus TaxID=33059 RepID=UPI001D026318
MSTSICGQRTPTELKAGLRSYFAWYNGERPHSSLGGKTPEAIYAEGLARQAALCFGPPYQSFWIGTLRLIPGARWARL